MQQTKQLKVPLQNKREIVNNVRTKLLISADSVNMHFCQYVYRIDRSRGVGSNRIAKSRSNVSIWRYAYLCTTNDNIDLLS